MRSFGRTAAAVVALCGLLVAGLGAQQDAGTMYRSVLDREMTLRKELSAHEPGTPDASLLRRIRSLVANYEAIVGRFPRSGYSDNALWQGAVLLADAYRHFGETADRTRSLRLFEMLRSEYPSSSLIRRIPEQTAQLTPPRPADGPVSLRAIRREVLPGVVRITLELDRETRFYDERLDGPPRVFVDLQNTRAVDALRDATIPYQDDVVRQVRIGRHPDGRSRVVLDLENAGRHSIYSLYNPYRLVIDIERLTPPPVLRAGNSSPSARDAGATPARNDNATPTREAAPAPVANRPGAPTSPSAPAREVPAARADNSAAASSPAAAPAPPSANTAGGFSISRQLGLGVSRIVIDPGHGGHDPGAQVPGLNEADVVLDIALRLEKLLVEKAGAEVVLTRRADEYVALEERTAIANRENADLFLSIHANASPNASAAGIETYFLNFANNSAAQAIAARENAGSVRTMSSLPDMVRAIATNNKIDESRDFATMMQTSLFDKLRRANSSARNLGVKQAPFVVLIGATMPSILAEVAFITNRTEANLLRTANYRQQIAEALFDGVLKYQQSLKKDVGVATR